jgi:hypothetical protein
MSAPNYPYVAIRTIFFNSVRAYNLGDLVPAEAVEGPDAWLKPGLDVKRKDAKSKP